MITVSSPYIRDSNASDLGAIRDIYNQGIADRIATLDEDPKTEETIREWYAAHGERYAVLVAERAGHVVGWASLNSYSHRCAYDGLADLSIYVERDARGTGIGTTLLRAIDSRAKQNGFHKIVLFALTTNEAGRRLYRNEGYKDVGIFEKHGRLDGRFVDVVAMERILKPSVLFVCRHNTGRSRMAEAFLRRITGDDVEVASAGTTPAERADPGVVAAMAEVDIDISAIRPTMLDPAMIARADRIITMGCDVEGVPRIDDDWGLPDPKGQPPERVREIRDLVRRKAGELAEDLASAAIPWASAAATKR